MKKKSEVSQNRLISKKEMQNVSRDNSTNPGLQNFEEINVKVKQAYFCRFIVICKGKTISEIHAVLCEIATAAPFFYKRTCVRAGAIAAPLFYESTCVHAGATAAPLFYKGALMFFPCLFCPSDNVWRSRRADAPWCAHFSNLFHTFLDH